jgi:hypothetical protein
MEWVNKPCSVCSKTVAIPMDVPVMMATNLAQARAQNAAAYCQQCDAAYCFDHILWKPMRISQESMTMTNVPVCPKCGELMGGVPS